MINSFKSFVLFLFSIELILYFSDTSDFTVSNNFISYFFIFLFLNFLFFRVDNKKFDLDLTFRYLILILKTPNFLVNYLINIFKKVFLFLIHIKYKHLYYTFIISIRKYTNSILIWWRPLFKKTSYFGYYRSNRSKWIK